MDMYCQRCGAENSEGVNFCAKCGNPLGQAAPPLQPQPTAARSSSKMLLVIVAVVVAVILIVAVIAVLLLAGGSNLEITDSSYTDTSAFGIVVFTVEVTNHGDSTDSGTIHCKVTFSNGDVYTGSRDITLAAGQSETFVITVTTGLTHILDSSGEYEVSL